MLKESAGVAVLNPRVQAGPNASVRSRACRDEHRRSFRQPLTVRKFDHIGEIAIGDRGQHQIEFFITIDFFRTNVEQNGLETWRMHRNTADFRIAQKAAGLRVRLALLRLRFALKAGFRHDQPRDDRGRWSGRGGSGTVQIIRIRQTGNPKIDRTTDHLAEIAAEVIEARGPGSGSAYGIAVHKVFAEKIRDLDLPGIGRNGVEQSFSFGDLRPYGLSGTVRTDVVKREDNSVFSPIIAVWDLKTGVGNLTPGRLQNIRDRLGIDETVPIIQIHVVSGVSVKSISTTCSIDHSDFYNIQCKRKYL